MRSSGTSTKTLLLAAITFAVATSVGTADLGTGVWLPALGMPVGALLAVVIIVRPAYAPVLSPISSPVCSA